MFRIERLKKPIGPGDPEPVPYDFLPGLYETVEAAEAAIDERILTYHHHGFDPKQGYWWARNTGDGENDIFVVRASDYRAG